MEDEEEDLWEVCRQQEASRDVGDDDELFAAIADAAVESQTGKATHKERSRVEDVGSEVDHFGQPYRRDCQNILDVLYMSPGAEKDEPD